MNNLMRYKDMDIALFEYIIHSDVLTLGGRAQSYRVEN